MGNMAQSMDSSNLMKSNLLPTSTVTSSALYMEPNPFEKSFGNIGFPDPNNVDMQLRWNRPVMTLDANPFEASFQQAATSNKMMNPPSQEDSSMTSVYDYGMQFDL
jgi:hypothetical protein